MRNFKNFKRIKEVAAVMAAGLVVFFGGCGSSDDGKEKIPPKISDLAVVENPVCSLSASASFKTDEPSIVRVEAWVGGKLVWTMTPHIDYALAHDFPILGLHADTAYQLKIIAEDAAGNQSTVSQDYTTAPLPDDFPPISLTIPDTENKTSPGFTLFSVMRFTVGVDNTFGYLVMVDKKGLPVWYYSLGKLANDVRRLPNGNITFIGGIMGYEIDMTGKIIHEWNPVKLGVDSMHHELVQLKNGNFFTLTTELRDIGGFTDAKTGEEVTYHVVGDSIVEFDEDGNKVKSWSLFDYPETLDHHFIAPDFMLPFWDILYGQAKHVTGTKDWTHANAAVYDYSDDSIIVSVRHFNLVMKISYETGKVIWTLGEKGSLKMKGEGLWQYYQHAPEVLGDGKYLIYDNGNYRSDAPANQEYSRAVIYKVDSSAPDPKDWTVEQVWAFDDGKTMYSQFICNADMLENGNVLVVDGGRTTPAYGNLVDPKLQKWARIVEVSGEATPKKLWEITIKADPEAENRDFSVYRGRRVKSIYPDGGATIVYAADAQ